MFQWINCWLHEDPEATPSITCRVPAAVAAELKIVFLTIPEVGEKQFKEKVKVSATSQAGWGAC